MKDLVGSEEYNGVQLFADTNIPAAVRPVTIASGEGELAAGTVLGQLTEGGKYAKYDNTANDGTQTAKLILAEAIDATDDDVNTTAYESGKFNRAALTGLDTAAEVDLDGSPILFGDLA